MGLSERGEIRMKLTQAQKEEVNQIQRDLIEQIGDREVTIEYTAAAMMELCENLDYDIAVSTCQRIWQGAKELYRLCRESDAVTEPDYVEQMLDRITEQMSKEQRKGFFLLALDSFEKNQFSSSETANRAAKTEQELKEILSDRIRIFSKDVLQDMAEAVEEFGGMYKSEETLLRQRMAKEDAFLFAVSIYLAGLNGILPQEFGEYPELLGICSAVQMVLFLYCEEFLEKGSEDIWIFSDMVSGLICAAFGAALMLTSSVAGIAAESVLLAMEFNQLGFFISIFCSAALSVWFVAGGLMFVKGVGTVIALCMKKIREQRQEREVQPAYSEQSGTVQTKAGWQNQKDTEEEQIRVRVVPNGF